jgi:hypothetical protein
LRLFSAFLFDGFGDVADVVSVCAAVASWFVDTSNTRKSASVAKLTYLKICRGRRRNRLIVIRKS